MELTSNIANIRDIEDCIRATKKYTKGVFHKKVEHPIQGAEFPSKVITEYYEVYPNVELSWDMPAGQAWALVWGDEVHIDIFFKYDYRVNRASVRVQDGNGNLRELNNAIPGFSKALEKAHE